MPKRGIKKRILNKVSALFSIRGAKHRLEIHGEQKDSSSPKQPDKNTIRGVMSSKTPQYKPRGIRFSRRAVQRSKYLRQKFGVRKTVMGFSPRVGSITEEDESEITLWMLADNAENVISEGMAWLTSEDCCEDSTGMEQEDHEKILQMWIQSNSFDDKDIYHDDDYESSTSFSEDDDDDGDDDDSCDQKPRLTDDDDDNNDDDGEDDNDDDGGHQNEIIKDYNSTGNEYDDVTQAAYDTGTESDDEDEGDDDDDMDDDDDDHTADNNENTGDSLNEINCSIYVDDESFDELDDYDGDDHDGNDDDDDQDDSHKQLESSGTDKHKEPAIETKTIGNNLTRESNIAVLDSANSQDNNNIFDSSTDANNDINMCEQTGCKDKSGKISGFEEEVDDNRVESELTHDKDSIVHVLDPRHDNDDHDHDSDDNNVDINQNDHTFSACNGRFSSKDDIKNNTAQADLDLDVKTQHEQTNLSGKGDQITPDDDVINTVKEEIDEILSRISQIESDFNFMRKSMNEFRSSDVQHNDTIQ